MPHVSQEFLDHYDKCMVAFEKLETMFDALDKYRAFRQNRKPLYSAHDNERAVRKLMKQIKAENQEFVK